MANSQDEKFTESPVAVVHDDGPEPVADTKARIEGLIADAKARGDNYLVKVYGDKLAALPKE